MKRLLLLLFLACGMIQAQTYLMPFRDAYKLKVSRGYDSTATTIVLYSGHGAYLPDAGFELIWYNASRYFHPFEDEDFEWIRVGTRSGDTLKSVLRGQNRTTRKNHNRAGYTYKVMPLMSENMWLDIDARMGVLMSADSADWARYSQRADTAVYAMNGGGGGDADTAQYAVNSGTASFALTATYATTSGGAPPTGLASGHLENYFPAPTIKNNVITGEMIRTGQVVKSFFGLYDNIYIRGEGGATVSKSGDTVIIAAQDTASGDSSGISGLQNTDGIISITNPIGPTATINLANNKIDSSKLGASAVGNEEIANGSITTNKVDPTFVAPNASHATVADSAYPKGSAVGGYILGTFPHGLYIATNGITSANQITDGIIGVAEIATGGVATAEILNGTILREDVGATFKAPYADTADHALTAYPSGPAGGVLGGTFPNLLTLNSNTIGASHIINQSVGRDEIDTNITTETFLVPGMILYAQEAGGDTNISSSTTPVTKLDSSADNHFVSSWENQDASKLIRNYLPASVIPPTTVTPGDYGAFTVGSDGRLTQASYVSGSGGGGGGGWTVAFRDSFLADATEDSVHISGFKSYWLPSVEHVMNARAEAWNANDDYKCWTDSNYVIIIRNSGGTSNAKYAFFGYEQTLAMPSGVDVTALSATSLRLTWTDPAYTQSTTTATTTRIGISYRTLQYDSVYETASNVQYQNLGVLADTITGLTEGQLYYICVFPVTRANESDTALSGSRDTCTTSGEEPPAEPFFNADSIGDGKLQFHIAARFLEGIISHDAYIVNGDIQDSSGFNHDPVYCSLSDRSPLSRIRFKTNALNGRAAFAFDDAYGDARDTTALIANAVAESLETDADCKYSMIVVMKFIDTTGTYGYTTNYRTVLSFDDSDSSNFVENRFYTPTPFQIQTDRRGTEGYNTQGVARGTGNYWGQWHIYEWHHDGTNDKFFIDGDSLGTFAHDFNTLDLDLFTIGTTRTGTAVYQDRWTSMWMTEALVFSKYLSYTDQNYYRYWLKYIYGIE